MAGPFDYLFNDRDTSNNLGVNVAARTPVSPPPDSDDPVAADPSQAAAALLDNIVFPRNNLRSPIFKDPATASAYETGLREFMKATGRTDMDPYGVSGRFYYPGIDRRGDPFSTNNRGMTQKTIDSINRLAYNQYLGLVSGKGFRKGGEGDPVPGYAPALKLGSDTPMGKVIADPNADEPVGIFGLLGRGNVPRVLDDMGVNYSTEGIDADMGDPVRAAVPTNIVPVSPTTSEIADAAANAKVFGGDTDSDSTAYDLDARLDRRRAYTPTVAEILLNEAPTYTGPFTSQVAEDIYMSGADTPVGTFTGGAGTGDTSDVTISSRPNVRPNVQDFERSLEDLEQSGARSDFLMDIIEELRRTNPLDEPVLSEQSLAPSTAPTDLTVGLGEELLGTRSTAPIDRTDDPSFGLAIQSMFGPTDVAQMRNRGAEIDAIRNSLIAQGMDPSLAFQRARMQVGG